MQPKIETIRILPKRACGVALDHHPIMRAARNSAEQTLQVSTTEGGLRSTTQIAPLRNEGQPRMRRTLPLEYQVLALAILPLLVALAIVTALSQQQARQLAEQQTQLIEDKLLTAKRHERHAQDRGWLKG